MLSRLTLFYQCSDRRKVLKNIVLIVMINVQYIFLSVISTAQKMKLSIKEFFSKCDRIRIFLRIWSHLLKKSLMENFIFCTVSSSTRSYAITNSYFYFCLWFNSIFKMICSFWLMGNRYVILIIPNDNLKKVEKSLRLSMTS